jgi:glycosyltransferase involved in cell wall biosynthesis
MRIAIAAAVPNRPEGGVANVVYNTAEALRGRGHQVECLFSEAVPPAPDSLARFRGLLFAAGLAKLLVARRDDFDVVTIHAPAGFAYGLARRLKLAGRLPPYVMFLHGLEERRNYIIGREAAKGRAPQFMLKNRLWQHLYHMSMFGGSIVTADQSVVIERETWTMLQLKYRRDIGRVWYIPNGVEPQFFVDRAAPRPGPPRLLFVGTWLDQRAAYLREAFAELARRRPDVRLTIAGSSFDDATIRSGFDPVARDRLDIRPFVSRGEMPQVYAEHDVFVFPSLFEGLPIALLEAMASGMPPVTTEVCGMKDVVEDGYNGLLVKPADAADLLQALERIVDSSDLRARLGRAAQETARRYTWTRAAEQLERVLERAVAAG